MLKSITSPENEMSNIHIEMAMNLIQRAVRIESLIDRLPGVNRTEPQQYQRLEGNILRVILDLI